VWYVFHRSLWPRRCGIRVLYSWGREGTTASNSKRTFFIVRLIFIKYNALYHFSENTIANSRCSVTLRSELLPGGRASTAATSRGRASSRRRQPRRPGGISYHLKFTVLYPNPVDSTAAASRGRASSRRRPSMTRSSPGRTRRTGPRAG
jgi:hypothetical protein